jgi:hypothetical protein
MINLAWVRGGTWVTPAASVPQVTPVGAVTGAAVSHFASILQPGGTAPGTELSRAS